MRFSLFATTTALVLCSTTFARQVQTVGGGDTAPVCKNNGPYTVDCNVIPGTTTTDVVLSSAGSFDPDGTPITVFWFEECASAFFADPTLPDATLTIDMAGTCTASCTVALRVTSNGVTSKCSTLITVTDMTAPTIACPPDAFLVWGDDTSPGVTGTATALDNCDPNPLVTYTEQAFTDPVGSGLEGHIVRTFTATDCMGLTSSCSHTIYLASPKAAGGGNLDLQLGSCPNVLDRSLATTYDVAILTNPKWTASQIDWTTVSMQRHTNTTQQISLATSTFGLGDIGKVTATTAGQCNSNKKDGKPDLRIKVDRTAMITGLGLDTEAVGTVVEVFVTGRLTTGKHFIFRDFVTVQ